MWVCGWVVIICACMYVWLHNSCLFVLFFAGFCDFEMDFCGWVNSPPAETGVDWDWLSGESGGNIFIPKKDHSTNSALGKSPTYTLSNGIIMSVAF